MAGYLRCRGVICPGSHQKSAGRQGLASALRGTHPGSLGSTQRGQPAWQSLLYFVIVRVETVCQIHPFISTVNHIGLVVCWVGFWGFFWFAFWTGVWASETPGFSFKAQRPLAM